MHPEKKGTSKSMPLDLSLANEGLYAPNRLNLTDLLPESESKEYDAFQFVLNNFLIKFRSAKITPTKLGQFVTLWKRVAKGPILPLEIEDPFDFVVISVRDHDHLGQFIFPKSVLAEKGIVSKLSVGGKRAFRVYPP